MTTTKFHMQVRATARALRAVQARNTPLTTSQNYDFVLLQFSQPAVTSLSFQLSTFNTTKDTDLTFFVGNCSGVCSSAQSQPVTGSHRGGSTLSVPGKCAPRARFQVRPSIRTSTIGLRKC